MNSKESPNTREKLFSEFPPVSTEAWEKVITEDLKGADYEKKLVWRTEEGFKVKPYYREEDLKQLEFLRRNPGEFPFVRGSKTDGNQWYIRQEIQVEQGKSVEANKKALQLLTKGVNSIGFRICGSVEISYDDFAALMANICLQETEVNFTLGKQAHLIVKYLVRFLDENKINYSSFKGSIELDPLGTLVRKGTIKSIAATIEEALEMVAAIRKEAAIIPGLKTIAIHGKYYGNAGATLTQELAFSLSQGVEYLSRLTEKGLSIEEISPAMKFVFSTGANYFLEIARIRAARLLWAHIIKEYGAKSEDLCKAYIHTETSSWNMTLYDPYVNMLRTTTESMSAIIGGTDSHTTLPFDHAYGESTEFSERIARNQQLLLKSESHFDKINDPAAGSYYLENLTNEIAEQAWKLFLKIEEEGGFYASILKGTIQGIVEETREKRYNALATRRDTLLGINQYPNFTEKMDKELKESLLMPVTCTCGGNCDVKTLGEYRGALAFEALRYRTDLQAAKSRRPKAFMMTIGNLAMRKARSQFACNFFACAGFEVVDNNGFKTVEEGVQAAIAANADITVLCSSDDEYATLAIPAFQQLTGKSIMVIAGNPACTDELQAAGIRHFISVKSNVLETLRSFQTELGI